MSKVRSKIYTLIFVPSILLGACQIATSATISDGISAISSDRVEDYYYHACQFLSTPVVKLDFDLRSRYDVDFILVSPEGKIISKNGYAPSGSRSNLDDHIVVDRPNEGVWLVIVTSTLQAGFAPYRLYGEGASGLQRIRPTVEERRVITRALTLLKVTERASRVNALVEQLALLSVRDELEKRLREEVRNRREDEERLRSEIRQFELRERDLRIAFENIFDALRAKGDRRPDEIVRSLVESELKVTRLQAERTVQRLVESLKVGAAFAEARRELRKLETVETELRKLEESLIMEASTEPGRERGRVFQLRRVRGALAKEIAEKLLDSRIVIHMPSGGFTFYDRDVLSDRSRSYGGLSYGGLYDDGPRDVIDPTVWLPALLPWPPPTPSSLVVLQKNFFARNGRSPQTFGELDDYLQGALARAGYSGSTYWGVPGGYAIVTPLEQINEDGIPLPGSLRWLTSIAEMKSFSLAEYIKALLTARSGYFRVLVFAVSSNPFSPAGSRAKLDTVEKWSENGFNVLPHKVSSEVFDDRVRVTVLVYEFLKRANYREPETLVPGRLRAFDHLLATKLAFLVKR
jgi:hypothetical protein